MLYKNDVVSLYEKLWSMGRKWPKRMLEMNKMAAGRHLELTHLSHLPTHAHQDPYSGRLGQHLYQI